MGWKVQKTTTSEIAYNAIVGIWTMIAGQRSVEILLQQLRRIMAPTKQPLSVLEPVGIPSGSTCCGGRTNSTCLKDDNLAPCAQHGDPLCHIRSVLLILVLLGYSSWCCWHVHLGWLFNPTADWFKPTLGWTPITSSILWPKKHLA